MRSALVVLPLLLAACSQPEYFEMKPSQITFESRGATKSIRAVGKDRRGNEYPTYKPTAWESSDETIAKVDAEGKVTATGPGVATIRARLGDLVGEVMVDVVTAEDLAVVPEEIRMVSHGDPFQPDVKLLDVRGRPLNGRMILAKCRDEKICTVDGAKKLWPHEAGETVFEVKHEGLAKEIKVVVERGRR